MKKDSWTIHREHAEQKAAKAGREKGGHRSRVQITTPPKPNPLTNPAAQLLAFAIRLHNSGVKGKSQKRFEYRRT